MSAEGGSPAAELAAMQKCVRALEGLDRAAQRRAVTYLFDRYTEQAEALALLTKEIDE